MSTRRPEPDRSSSWLWAFLGALGGAVVTRLVGRRGKKTSTPPVSGAHRALGRAPAPSSTPEAVPLVKRDSSGPLERSDGDQSGGAAPRGVEQAEREPKEPGELPRESPEGEATRLEGAVPHAGASAGDLPPQAVIERGHESEADTHTRGVLIGASAVLATVVVGMLALGWLMQEFRHLEVERAGPMSPFADVEPLPPAPRLQADPAVDLAAMHAREDRLLTTYGVAEDGAVRIPVERAMVLLAERGLPVRTAPVILPDTVRTESGFTVVLPPGALAPTAPPVLGASAEPYAPSPRIRRLLDTLDSLPRSSGAETLR